MSQWLMNDDNTDVKIVRPSSYGYAQPDYQHKSRKRKHPLGFITEVAEKPKRKTTPTRKAKP